MLLAAATWETDPWHAINNEDCIIIFSRCRKFKLSINLILGLKFLANISLSNWGVLEPVVTINFLLVFNVNSFKNSINSSLFGSILMYVLI